MAFRGAFKVKTWDRKKTQVSSTINDYLDLNYLWPLRFGWALWWCDCLPRSYFRYTKTTENSNIICGGRIVPSCGSSYIWKDLFCWPTELWIMKSIQSKGFTQISELFEGLFWPCYWYWIPIIEYGLTLGHVRVLPSDQCPTFTVSCAV